MTPELCAAFDRSQVTHRNAIFILSVAYKSVGINLSTLNLSYSTIYRTQIKFRSDIAKDLKSEFHKDDRYVVHWDGKILSDIASTKTVDRIAVLLSVSGVDQLLGVPKADDETALKQASAVIDTLNQWEVAPYVKAMCFDTPPVNTGIYKGTCVLIKKELGRKLVWLPCRHHIMEIILRGLFEDKVDQSNYKSGIEDETVANTLIEKKAEIVTFINNCLQMSALR
ncbi:uncharacterized protein LOC123270129 [Cotesia glomerata]|uniref:uncharacterized protein LOC123270129 n=1 Tax=Cotesia glomerata TaxID=32391 RepID=UPI001D00FA58|nr:uncharacterized protein LOC123270129 [Cotesia glomerata]